MEKVVPQITHMAPEDAAGEEMCALLTRLGKPGLIGFNQRHGFERIAIWSPTEESHFHRWPLS
jgi:hypothetical protein